MPQTPLPERPVNLVLESRSSNDLRVGWDPVLNADFYELEVSWIGQTPLSFPATTPQNIAMLLQLDSNRAHNIRVRAVNSAGKSDFSNMLFAVTLPPKPLPLLGSSSMIESDLTLTWDIQLSKNVDMTHPLAAEIKKVNDDQIVETNLPLIGKLVDQPTIGDISYSIRLFSQVNSISPSLRNESEWSDKVTISKRVFDKMEIPRSHENQQIRIQLMNRNYLYL